MTTDQLIRLRARCARNESHACYAVSIRTSELRELIADLFAARETLDRIARPLECGCKPCTGDCRSPMALECALDEKMELASDALRRACGSYPEIPDSSKAR